MHHLLTAPNAEQAPNAPNADQAIDLTIEQLNMLFPLAASICDQTTCAVSRVSEHASV